MPRSRLSALAFAILLLGNGCVRSEISSYTDPGFRQAAAVSSVAVFGMGMGLEERRAVEDGAVARLVASGVRGIRGLDIAPPTRQLDTDQVSSAILASGANGVLFITATAKGESSTYVPSQYYPGSVQGTATTTGNLTTFNMYQNPGYTTGGYSISKPNAQYSAVLLDDHGNRIWQADIASRGSAFDDYQSVAEGMASDVVAGLVEDGIVGARRPAQLQTANAGVYSGAADAPAGTSTIGSESNPSPAAAGYAPGRSEAEPFADSPGYAALKEIEGLSRSNPTEARHRLTTIAERGNPLAMLAVAAGYADGSKAFPKDCDLARHWLDRSAHSISGWNATVEDKGQLRAIVAMLRSDPEIGISTVCPE